MPRIEFIDEHGRSGRAAAQASATEKAMAKLSMLALLACRHAK
jgi:hypothetical protein